MKGSSYVLFGGFLFLLSSCGGLNTSGSATSRQLSRDSNTALDDNTGDDSVTQALGLVEMNWGSYQNHRSGLAESSYIEGFRPTGSDFHGNFCFSNDNYAERDFVGNVYDLNCENAGNSIRSTIQENPVAVQSFRMKVSKKGYHKVEFTGATVSTAVLKFNTHTGEPVFTNKVKTSFGQGCSLNHSNAVGFDKSRDGEERILTSLQIFDEYSVCSTQITGSLQQYYCRAFLSAGRIWFSGLIPFASDNYPYQFDYVPQSAPADVTMGALDYNTVSNDDVLILPQFGAHADDEGNVLPRYTERVITGFCARGYKQRTSSSAPRNLFLGAKARTYRPLLRAVGNRSLASE